MIKKELISGQASSDALRLPEQYDISSLALRTSPYGCAFVFQLTSRYPNQSNTMLRVLSPITSGFLERRNSVFGYFRCLGVHLHSSPS